MLVEIIISAASDSCVPAKVLPDVFWHSFNNADNKSYEMIESECRQFGKTPPDSSELNTAY